MTLRPTRLARAFAVVLIESYAQRCPALCSEPRTVVAVHPRQSPRTPPSRRP
jgi:hypothetical protein